MDGIITQNRATNFSKQEEDTIRTLVEKYNVVICKKTNGSSTKQKDNAWACILRDFNAVHTTNRTLKQLKNKFDNIKKYAKKESTKEREGMIQTGDGKPPSLPPASEDATDWLSKVMSGSIKGNAAIYDDDIIVTEKPHTATSNTKEFEMEYSPLPKRQKLDEEYNDFLQENIPEKIFEDTITAEADATDATVHTFDGSAPHSSLKRPMATPLRRKITKNAEDNILNKKLKKKN